MTDITPLDTATTVFDDAYGEGSPWAEPNSFGESGFTLAQVETDINADDVIALMVDSIDHHLGEFAGTAHALINDLRQLDENPAVREVIEFLERVFPYDTESSGSRQHFIETGKWIRKGDRS